MTKTNTTPSGHEWVFDGVSPHNGEYWYKCTRCEVTDWLSRGDKPDELWHNDKPCAFETLKREQL